MARVVKVTDWMTHYEMTLFVAHTREFEPYVITRRRKDRPNCLEYIVCRRVLPGDEVLPPDSFTDIPI